MPESPLSVLPGYDYECWTYLCQAFIEGNYYKERRKELATSLAKADLDERARAACLYDFCSLMQEVFLTWQTAMQNCCSEIDREYLQK